MKEEHPMSREERAVAIVVTTYEGMCSVVNGRGWERGRGGLRIVPQNVYISNTFWIP